MRTRTCTVCGAVETEPLEALGHDVVTFSGYPATCMWGGWSDGSYCRRCDKTLTQQERLPATGKHTPRTVAAKDPPAPQRVSASTPSAASAAWCSKHRRSFLPSATTM